MFFCHFFDLESIFNKRKEKGGGVDFAIIKRKILGDFFFSSKHDKHYIQS